MTDPATGFLWFLAFLFSTTVHEAMHAWAAMKGGDLTAYHGGQVSLSPIPHIQREPIGMLVLPLLTAMTQGWAIGWASAPYDPYWAARYPKRAAVMAAAGPIGNLILAAIAFTLLKVGLNAGWFVAPASVSFSGVVEATAGGHAGVCRGAALDLPDAERAAVRVQPAAAAAAGRLGGARPGAAAVTGDPAPAVHRAAVDPDSRPGDRVEGLPAASAGRCSRWCWRCCTRGRAIGRRRVDEA